MEIVESERTFTTGTRMGERQISLVGCLIAAEPNISIDAMNDIFRREVRKLPIDFGSFWYPGSRERFEVGESVAVFGVVLLEPFSVVVLAKIC